MTAVACDLDGVVYIDGRAVPGAGEALQALRDGGRRILFVTNNSTKTPEIVADDVYALTGFSIDPADVLTSGRVTALALHGIARRVLIVGSAPLVGTFEEAGFEVVDDRNGAEAVVVGLDPDLTYDQMAEATLAIREGALFYATNTDATYPTADGLKPGGGAIVSALVTATGVEPVVCGKPHAPMRDALRALAGSGAVLVVGDRPDTDIAMGRAEGWPTALVLTGVTTHAAVLADDAQPEIVIESLADLPAVLEA